jgi:hypothetical protein
MTQVLTNKRTYSSSGASVTRSDPRESDSISTIGPITVPKGKASTAFTKLSASTGTLTLSTGHGIATSQIVDLYWSGGQRLRCNIGTVSGLTVPIASGGVGSDLPASATVVTVAARVLISAPFDVVVLQLAAFKPDLGNGTLDIPNSLFMVNSSSGQNLDIPLLSGNLKTYDIAEELDTTFTDAFDQIPAVPDSWYLSNSSSVSDMTFSAILTFNF